MRIAFIGHGNVGAPLADRLQRLGHDVVLAVGERGGASAALLLERNPGLRIGPIADAVVAADVVFLATPYQANQAVTTSVAGPLAGKILVDCTNPVGAGLTHGLASMHSGSEVLQRDLPSTRVVKAFSVYGYENFEDNAYPAYDVKPAMLFCGDDAAAKASVGGLVAQLGWEPVDVGGLEQALHLEHMTLLWIRLVRVHGHSPHLVWAALRR